MVFLRAMTAAILIAATPSTLPPVAPPAAAVTQPLIMLAGDSVPRLLSDALADEFAARGWRLVDAAAGGCGVVGDHIVNADGTTLASGDVCPDVVWDRQRAALAKDPDIVLWWDRFSLADFKTVDGEHIRAGTDRFWRLRQRKLARRVAAFTNRGADVVFLATEPPGRGIRSECTPERCHPWLQRMITRYDRTMRWNRTMRNYARAHPNIAAYRTITSSVCRDTDVPCGDRMANGDLFRGDGRHYTPGLAERTAARLIARRIATAL